MLILIRISCLVCVACLAGSMFTLALNSSYAQSSADHDKILSTSIAVNTQHDEIMQLREELHEASVRSQKLEDDITGLKSQIATIYGIGTGLTSLVLILQLLQMLIGRVKGGKSEGI
jgi:hypothetical protein